MNYVSMHPCVCACVHARVCGFVGGWGGGWGGSVLACWCVVALRCTAPSIYRLPSVMSFCYKLIYMFSVVLTLHVCSFLLVSFLRYLSGVACSFSTNSTLKCSRPMA